jgi:putative transcriptional regulator
MVENKVQELRKQRGLSQEELAAILGVVADYVSMIERGKRSPGFALAKKIADFFDMTIDEIFFNNESNNSFDVKGGG